MGPEGSQFGPDLEPNLDYGPKGRRWTGDSVVGQSGLETDKDKLIDADFEAGPEAMPWIKVTDYNAASPSETTGLKGAVLGSRMSTSKPQFHHRGNEAVYLSRSVAVVAISICIVAGEGYVPVGKRRIKPGDEQSGRYGLCCGYLDWDESAAEAMMRELYELSLIHI